MVASTLVVLGQLEENTEEEVVNTASQIGALPTIIGFVPVETTTPRPTIAPTQPPTSSTSSTSTSSTSSTSSVAPSAGTIKVTAKGSSGGESMKVLVDGQVIGVVPPSQIEQNFAVYTFNHSSALTIDRVEIAFDNNGTFNGIDSNLIVQQVDLDGVVHGTIGNPALMTTGAWNGQYCTNNEYYSATDTIACNGSFRWVERTPDLDCNWHEFTRTGGFIMNRDGNDNNTRHIGVPNGGQQDGYAECLFEVTTPGIYRLLGNISAPSGLDNSFFVSIDSGPSWLWDTPQSTPFINDNVNDRNNQDPVLVNLAAGQYNVRVALREDGTKLRSMTLVYDSPPPPPEKLVCNAPDFALAGNMILGATGTTQYIYTPNGTGTSYNAPTNDTGTCTFTVSEAGTYRLEGLVSAPNGSDDSFWVLWKGNTIQWRTGNLSSGAFFNDWVGQYGGMDPFEVNLAEGDHTVVVTRREDGTHLSKLTLVKVN